MQCRATSIFGRKTIFLAVCASTLLAACGSSDSSEGETQSEVDTPVPADNDMDNDARDPENQSSDFSDTNNGTGTITIDGTTYTFGLKCTFGAETMNEDVSISIVGESDSVGMAFTQMSGLDLSTGQLSKDVPEDHSITIYELPGVLLKYEYLSLTTQELLDVSGRTVSGTTTFAKADAEGETFGQPTVEGNVNLVCD